MRRFRYWLATRLRLIAWRIEPRPNILDKHLGDLIVNISPIDTPVLTDPDFRLLDFDDEHR